MRQQLFLFPLAIGILWIAGIYTSLPMVGDGNADWLSLLFTPERLAMVVLGVASASAMVLMAEFIHWRPGWLLIGYAAVALPAIRVAGVFGKTIAIALFAKSTPLAAATGFGLLYVAIGCIVLCIGAGLSGLGGALLPALPPAWRAAAGRRMRILFPSRIRTYRTVLLFTLLVGLIVYFWERIEVSLSPETSYTARQSTWIEREQAIYRAAIADGHYDVLVAPFQTDGLSVDRIGRALMMRMLSDRLVQRTNLKLPDPTWLTRAFNTHARTVPEPDLRQLAERIGARMIVLGYVSRPAALGRMKIALVTLTRPEGSDTWSAPQRREWPDLAFDDTHPPEMAFRDNVEAMIAALPLEQPPAAAAPTIAATPTDVAADPLTLARHPAQSPAERALALQFMAMLHDPGLVESEQLWERSLVALESVDSDSEYGKLLKARAYLHLYRRPAAEILLGKATTPAARAFDGVLKGNLPLAEQYANAISEPMLRLIALLEAEDLRSAYGKTPGYQDRSLGITRAYPSAAWFMRLRLRQGDWFNPEIHPAVRRMLLDAGVSDLKVSAPDVLDFAGLWLRWLYFQDPRDAGAMRNAARVEESYDDLVKNRAAAWRELAAGDRLAEWDYFDLLYSLNRSAAAKNVHGRLYQQALPRIALREVDELKPVFRDYPPLAYFESYALWKLGEENGDRNAKLSTRSRDLAHDVYRWEGGETPLSRDAEWATARSSYDKYADEPPRSWRHDVPVGELIFHDTSIDTAKTERNLASLMRRLQYTQTDFAILKELDKSLRELRRQREADTLFAHNRERFLGSQQYAEFQASRLERQQNHRAAIVQFEEIIRGDPNTWSHYLALGKLLMRDGDDVGADKILGSYPGFTDRSSNPVWLANYAHDTAEMFHRLGAIDRAIPWYRRSLSYETGAAAEMTSAEYLAYFGGDLRNAALHARRRVDRYHHAGSAGRYLAYLFLMGEDAQAWRLFREMEPGFNDPGLWFAAFVGHRLAGIEDDAIRGWVIDARSFDSRRNYLSQALRERHAFMALAIDRPVPKNIAETLTQVTNRYNHSPFYVGLAVGYLALRNGNYGQAATQLRPLSNDLTGISKSKQQAENFVLPYLVLAQVKAGDDAGASATLEKHRLHAGEDFDYYIGLGMVAGYRGNAKLAQSLLQRAFQNQPKIGSRAWFPLYELVEVTEWLYRDKRDPGYRDILLRASRTQQKLLPLAWAYAAEASYTDSADRRKQALGVALFLDPRSERASHFPEKDRQEAAAWFARSDFFGGRKTAPHRPGDLTGAGQS